MAINPTKPGAGRGMPAGAGACGEGVQDIEQLQKRHTDLDRRKAAAQANLETANASLDALKKQAQAAYGTDDLDQLKARLEAMKAENERKRAEYQAHLDAIEARLGEVDQRYQQARSGETA